MRDYIGIILVTMSVLRPGDCGNCGTLKFEKPSYKFGGCASLIYKPKNLIAGRQWYKEVYSGNQWKITILNISSTSKYSETNQTGQFTLTINKIEEADAGPYIVYCAPGYSNRAYLNTSSDPFHCGELEFEKPSVYLGESASLIYKPDCAMASFVWYYRTKLGSNVRLYPNKTSENSTKYIELKTDEGFILKIGETKLADAGNYFISCGTWSGAAELNVKVDPESIDIKSQPTKENETSNVQCTTITGRPPITSLFYLNNNQQNSVNITKTIQSGNTYNVTTTLWRKLTRQENQASVRCCNPGSPPVCSNTEYLNVTFPPKSVVLSEVSKVSEENGDTVLVLKCNVDDSNPKSFVYWEGVKNLPRQHLEEKYTSHTATHGWTYTTSWMFNLTKEDRCREITCQVKNSEFPDLRLQQSYTPEIAYPSEKSYSQPSKGVESNSLGGAIIGGAVIISITIVAVVVFLILWKKRKDKSPKRERTQQLKDEHRNESAHREGNESCKNMLVSNKKEVENAPEYECVGGTDHLNSEYERLQNLDIKRVYAELDLHFDSTTGARRLHNVSQPKTDVVKTDDDEMETYTN